MNLSNAQVTIHGFFWFRKLKTVFFLFVMVIFPILILPAQNPQVLPLDYHQTEDGRVIFYTTNTLISQAYLFVDFPQLRNMEASVELPYRLGVTPDQTGNPRNVPLPEGWQPGQRDLILFSLEPRDPGTGRGYSTSFQVRYRSAWGNPDTVTPDGFSYWLPYEHGTKHQLTQGFNGNFTHFGENQFALDFDLDTGTPVHAARAGVVIEVKEDSNRGGSSAAYSQDANFILIAHQDGTFGNYVHLQPGGSLVKPGDRIEAGDHIGFSGNTGRSSGPHLHFDVRIPTHEGRMISIPIELRGRNGIPEEPREGRFYYAYHPGGPAFEAVFGSELSNQDYEDHTASIAATDTITFRTEEVDSTIIVFLQNGFAEPQYVEVQLGLTNMTSTRGRSVSLEVPGTTEVFLTILRPNPGVSRAAYRFQYRYSPR